MASQSQQHDRSANFSFEGPVAMCRRLFSRWDLILDFSRRELVGRYKGSILGIFWSLVQPLFMLGTYTLVFGVLMKTDPDLPIGDFALMMFSGMIIFNLMSEAVGEASSLILNRPTFVKKVVFPLEILPLVKVLVAIAHFFFGLAAFLMGQVLLQGQIQPTILLTPIWLVPLLFFTLGSSYFLASLGVFLKDVRETVGVIMMAWMFLTPIFYRIRALPESIHIYLYMNPLTLFVVDFRGLAIQGVIPGLGPLCLAYVIFGVWLILGYNFFMRTKDAFGDVI